MIQLALLPTRNDKNWKLAKRLLMAGPLVFGFMAVWLGQDANWDLRNYHWYNAYAFLNGRDGFDLLPSQTPYFYNPLMDVPVFWVNRIFPARACGLSRRTLR